MMNKKMGRPTDNPKCHEIKARLDEETYKILIDYCAKKNILISEGVREGIRNLRCEKYEGKWKENIVMNEYERRVNEEWEKFQKQKKDELYPNIMLIGCSGAGKSSLINKIFGGNYAATSNVRPETEGYNKIYWGKRYGSSVNLIDTAGYEVNQGDTYCKTIINTISEGIDGEAIHVIWYCIPITNERVQKLDILNLQTLFQEPGIRGRVCVVFTKCDEDSEDSEKARALKNVIEGSCLEFPVRSFETSAKEGIDLELHDLIQWSASVIDDEDLRNKFIAAQMVDLHSKHIAAQKVIAVATAAAATVGATPIPFSDAVLLVPVQVGMIGKIIYTYGVSNLAHISKTVVSNMIITNLGKSLASNLLKMVPLVGQWVGGAINAAVASALTGAIGIATSEICYNNVKKYLKGQTVAWEEMFATEEFSDLVTKVFNTRMNKKKGNGGD